MQVINQAIRRLDNSFEVLGDVTGRAARLAERFSQVDARSAREHDERCASRQVIWGGDRFRALERGVAHRGFSKPRRTLLSHRAFTLIELLVVIAVIAVFTGLLLPTLSRSKALAIRLHCQGNLRQLGVAMAMYADDFDRYPPTMRLMQVLDPVRHWPVGTTVSLWNAALLPYVAQSTEVFNCRAFPARYRWTTNPSPAHFSFPTNIQGNRPFSYALNRVGVAAVGNLGIQSEKLGTGRKPGEIRVPSDMIALGDDTALTNKVGSWGSFIIWPTIGEADEAHIGVSRVHGGGANMVFLDGHMEWGHQRAWLAATEEATRRWNYDNESHPEYWR